jgi:hypothetical protein
MEWLVGGPEGYKPTRLLTADEAIQCLLELLFAGQKLERQTRENEIAMRKSIAVISLDKTQWFLHMLTAIRSTTSLHNRA